MTLTTVQVQAADGTIDEVIGDVVNGRFYPLYKLVSGVIGAAGDVVSDAAPLPVKLTDGMIGFEMDPLGYLVIIDNAHHKIHEENSYSVSHIFNAIASSGVALLRIQVPAGVRYHWTASVATILKAEAELLEGTTHSAPGTPVTERNRNRSSSNTSGAGVFHTPTINVAGTVLTHSLIPAGTKINQSQGAVAHGRNEWVLEEDTDYLLRVTNTGAQASDIGIEMDWYEVSV